MRKSSGDFVTTGLVQAELNAVLAAVTDDAPRVMTVNAGEALPSGPLTSSHRSLQAGLRARIEAQTGHPVGFLEQLYTFADLDRDASAAEPAAELGAELGAEALARLISISYLGLVREQAAPGAERPEWHGWYEYFPWEDRREGAPPDFEALIASLQSWVNAAPSGFDDRQMRVDYAFGRGGAAWNEDLVLQRYELLYEAGLVGEAGQAVAGSGRQMQGDHRRILATGIARLRAKIKYRPVAFELLPENFTFLQLQRVVEALIGLRLHKSNFRRQIDQQELIEETGETAATSPGRPAALFRYRPAVLAARALSGTRLPVTRG